jgi:hypothetical protein
MTRQDLIRAIEDIWYNEITQEDINKLIIGKLNRRGERIDSMVDQWRDLAKAGGEPTKY